MRSRCVKWQSCCLEVTFDEVLSVIRTGRLTTLQKSTGEVAGGHSMTACGTTRQQVERATARSTGLHRGWAESFVEASETGVGPVSLVEAEDCRQNLTGVMGFEPPSWSVLAAGARPPPPLDDPGGWRTGWHHEAASRVDRHFRDTSLPRQNGH